MQLRSKTAFVSGGTSGIGLATAKAFVEHGAYVVFTRRDRQRIDNAIALIGSSCAGVVADAADDRAMSDALKQAAERSGGIDVLFANAGHYVHSALGDTTRVQLQTQLSVVENIHS